MEINLVLKYKDNCHDRKQKHNLVDKFIELAKHYVIVDQSLKAEELLINLGFTVESVKKFVQLSKEEISTYDEDFQFLLKGKISNKYLN